jgi:hypothetical protein
MNVDKKDVVTALIKKIKKENPVDLKTALLKDYTPPDKIKFEGIDDTYTPTVLAIFKDHSDVYELELDENYEAKKYRLFSSYAKMKNGNFHLVIPSKYLNSAKIFFSENNIHAKIIHFATRV